MNYNKLRYFYGVCQTMNLTHAAQTLYISQPALSKHMADLEREFGVPLFVRGHRKLTLTPAGEVLQEECTRMFAHEDTLYRRVRGAATSVTPLTLAFMGLGAAYRIPELLETYRREFPQITVHTLRLNWDMVSRAVEEGQADVGLKLSSGEKYPDHIGRCILREDHVAAILPQKHPLAGASILSLEQLKEEPFLFLDKSGSAIPHDHAMRMCHRAGFSPRIAAIYPNVETVVMMVQGGAGIALLSSFAPLEGLGGVVCIPLTQAPSISLDLLWHKDNPHIGIPPLVELAQAFDW